MTLKAIIFGSIGTLVETSELQRQAFNEAFDNVGLDWTWEADEYAQMLAINGGQKRIRAYAERVGLTVDDTQVKAIHADKSAIYQRKLIDEGLTLRPGVGELINTASAKGLTLAFASTTSLQNIEAIFRALGDDSPQEYFALITSAGTVPNGKPAPDVYLYLLEQLGVQAGEAIAIEDTAISMKAALHAGVKCVALPGAYAQGQDYTGAVAVADANTIQDVAWLESLVR